MRRTARRHASGTAKRLSHALLRTVGGSSNGKSFTVRR
jgi:hypothetical protein